MAVSCAGAVGGREGGRPVTGGAPGCARAAARRAPQGAKAELPAGRGECPAGACARPAERAVRQLACREALPRVGHAPDGAARSARL